VIQDFIESHPEDASVACFGLELMRNGSFHFDYENNGIFSGAIRLLVGSMIRHIQEFAVHCMDEAITENGDSVDKVHETGALHALSSSHAQMCCVFP
jgi:hypothetical protein